MTYYQAECPASGTIGTGQSINGDGISLGSNSTNFAVLYYVVLVGSSGPTGFASVALNFRLIT